MAALGLYARRSLAATTGLFAAMLLGYWALTPLVVTPGSAKFLETFSHCYQLGPLAAIHLAPERRSPTPEADAALIDDWVPRAQLAALYHPVMTGPDMAVLIQRFAALPPEKRQRLDALYWRSALWNPQSYMADRVGMFLGAAGLSDRIFVITNELRNDHQQEAWRPIESYSLHRPAHLAGLARATDGWLAAALSRPGPVPGVHLVFNHLPALAMLLAALALGVWLPSAGLYAGVVLVAAAAMFVAYPASDWRYLYFLTLGACFVPPLAAADWSLRARRRGVRP
jgi:hypothetical protein